MRLVAISVESYSGYKADETPRAFMLEGRRSQIAGVLDRWYQGDRDPEWPMADYFRVADQRGQEYIIKRDRESDQWFLVNE